MRRGGVVKGAFLVLLALLMVLTVTGADWPDGDMDAISNDAVSRTMFGDEWTSGYAFVVFMIGLLLLVAILGGVFLAKEERE
jgi:NADH:ubiquinone oxidoreductase subunit 6 (subunit J)